MFSIFSRKREKVFSEEAIKRIGRNGSKDKKKKLKSALKKTPRLTCPL